MPERWSRTTSTSLRDVRALREHGQREKYRHAFEGYTARLDTIQALVLLRKLPLLERLEQAAARRPRGSTLLRWPGSET